jgi:hypothetical protein
MPRGVTADPAIVICPLKMRGVMRSRMAKAPVRCILAAQRTNAEARLLPCRSPPNQVISTRRKKPSVVLRLLSVPP